MASLLEGALKKKIAAAFKGRLTKGMLWRETSGSLDSWGDLMPGTLASYKFEGIRESFSAFYAATAGIPLTDVSILILLGSIRTTPLQTDELYLDKPWFKWYQIRRILEIDPAQASMKLQCFEIPGQP